MKRESGGNPSRLFWGFGGWRGCLLRRIRTMNYATRSMSGYVAVLPPPSLSLYIYIYISRSLFTGGERADAFKPILHGITRQARACCIKQKGEEESSLRIAPTWFRRGLPRGRLAGKQNASGLSSTPASTRTRFTYRYSARCQ